MIEITADEAAMKLDQLMQSAASGVEVIIVGSAGSVRLQPVPVSAGERRIGGLPGLIQSMSDDFCEPMDDFREYMP